MCTFSAFSVREMTKTNNALPNESALCYPYSLPFREGWG